MSHTEQELRALYRKTWELPKGPVLFAALEEVIRHADALELTEFAFEVRMRATDAFQLGGAPSRSFLTFAWCLAAYDREPARFGGNAEHQLLWHLKWMIGSLPDFPEIPLARTLDLLDDMERRYRRGGHSMHAVLQHRGEVAQALGDLAGAQRWYEEMNRTRRDSLSDCSGCVPGSQVRVLTALGQDEEAIRIGGPARRGGGCVSQPQWINSELLLAYVRTGRGAEAAEAHLAAYRAIRNSPEHLSLLAPNLLFCVHSGNPDRGLGLVERHLAWLDRPGTTPLEAMEFTAAAAAVLARFEARGEGGYGLRFPTVDGRRRPDCTVAELAGELRGRARELAARFDARNGNGHQSGRVEAWLSAGPIGEPVALSGFDRRLPSSDPDAIGELTEQAARQTAAGEPLAAARTRTRAAAALRGAGRLPEAAAAAEDAVRALDRLAPAEEAATCRYLLAQVYREAGQTEEAVAALRELLEPGAAAPGVPSAPELHQQIARLYAYDRRAPEHHLAAARGFGAAGRVHTQLDELRLALKGLAYFGLPGGVEVLAEADAVVAAAPAGDGPGLRAVVAELHVAAAEVLRKDGRPADARHRLLAARPVLERSGPSAELGELLTALSELQLAVGDPFAAEEAARAALAQLDDPVDEAWDEAIALILALRAQGRGEEASEAMELYSVDEEDVNAGSGT